MISILDCPIILPPETHFLAMFYQIIQHHDAFLKRYVITRMSLATAWDTATSKVSINFTAAWCPLGLLRRNQLTTHTKAYNYLCINAFFTVYKNFAMNYPTASYGVSIGEKSFIASQQAAGNKTHLLI